MMNSRPTKKRDAARGPLGEWQKRIRRMTDTRAFLMAVSFLCAVLVWAGLMASDGTLTREKVLGNVSVSVTGEALLKSQGYIVMEDVRELVGKARMTIEVTQANYDRVTSASYNPHFDLAQINAEGTHTLNIAYSSQLYGKVISCEPSQITVTVERYITRRVPVSLEMTGDVPEGTFLDAARTDPTTVSVSGPQSLVNRVSRVVAQMNLDSLTTERMNDKTSVNIRLQDINGQDIESDKLEISSQGVYMRSVIAETDLVPVKSVMLDIDGMVRGTPREGYELREIRCAQQSVKIAASEEILDAITALTVEQPMNIEDATADVTGSVRLKRPAGIENTVPYEITVTAVIEEKTAERTLSRVPLQIEGEADALTAKANISRLRVRLSGGYTQVNAAEAEQIVLYADVSGLEPGSYMLPVRVRADGMEDVVFTPEPEEVEVTITEGR